MGLLSLDLHNSMHAVVNDPRMEKNGKWRHMALGSKLLNTKLQLIIFQTSGKI